MEGGSTLFSEFESSSVDNSRFRCGCPGGIFAMLAANGKQDRMLLATELLNRRIREIMDMRGGPSEDEAGSA